MTAPCWYWPLVWALIIAGLLLAGFFLFTFRPSRKWPPRLQDVDSSGWVAIVFLMLAMSAVRAAGGYPPPRSTWFAVTNVVMGAGLDVLLLIRALHWQRVRRQFNNDPNHAAIAADERRT